MVAQALACVVDSLAFDQIEIPVVPAHQDRHPIGLGIAIDHVVLGSFHFEHRLFQGHGLVPIAVVYAKHLLISALSSREGNLLASLSFFRWRGGWKAIHSPGSVFLVALREPFFAYLPKLLLQFFSSLPARRHPLPIRSHPHPQ